MHIEHENCYYHQFCDAHIWEYFRLGLAYAARGGGGKAVANCSKIEGRTNNVVKVE